MSLWKKLLGEFIDIVEWTDDSNDTLVWRFERYQNEIKNGAQLTVRQGQVAIFVNEGIIADVFEAGMYSLTTENLPILSTLKGWKHGFNSPFKAEVYFLNTRTFVNNKWGTKNPIMLRDLDFGPVRLRAFGNYDVQVSEPVKLLEQVVGTDGCFQIHEIHDQLRTLAVSRFSDALAESQIPIMDMASNYDELSTLMQQRMNVDFNAYGLTLSRFIIENISLPASVEAILDKRTSINIIGGLDQYSKFQTATAIEQAANHENSASSALEMGAGIAMAHQMVQSMGAPAQTVTPPPIDRPVHYYVAVEGKQTGPFSEHDIRQQIAQGQLGRHDKVWKQGLSDWTCAENVGELNAILRVTPPPIQRA
ncbi:antifreeze protein [Vibrio coralliilyticus]|uniref:Antifreeze protein n=1 Tax=Vibrio coralliilyticus TaxID=190893 RepID=A0A837G9R8_9VIBR|nr:SPFH domain-containing protein [Vibrio coralliilyticus]KJY73413.1 antifreeze protein [Vibrio coralliilyticus]QOU33205.1 SPFH domain-containing protein [Vibrio coralliilyticus]